MYLKSLEINGFKSFSEKVVLDFLRPKNDAYSITAIVGPNGSGKSNIADAIRWVLGEQSMKVLRAKKSEDLIFSGSESKGKMGMASVTITIDNSDGRLPIEYDELVITRRSYRTGESEYLINGNNVRLIDLQILLAKAQFGQGSYSVIGQGMIDRLLLQTPSERKDFFDEAFGIKEFQIKRHQAVLKLARTKDNITQAEALLAEVSPRLKSLSRQVKKLEERQEIEKTLNELQEAYYLTLWNNNEEQLKELRSDLNNIDLDYKKYNEELNSIQVELAKLAKESSRQDVYNELQGQYQDLIQKKNNLEKERSTLEGKMQVEYSKVGKHNVGWLENKISSLKQDQDKLQRKIDDTHKSLINLQDEHSEKKKDIDKLTVERVELRGSLNTLENQLIKAKSEENLIQAAGLKAVKAVLDERQNLGKIFGAVAQLAEVEEKYQLAMDVAAGGHLSSVVVGDDRVAEECIRFLRREHLGFATFLPLNKIKPRFIPNNIQDFLDMPGVHGLAIELANFSDKFKDVFSYVFGNTLVVEDIEVARRIGIGRIRMVTLDGDIVETSGSMKGGYRRQKTSGLSFANNQNSNFNNSGIADHTEKIEQIKQDLDNVEANYDKTYQSLLSVKAQLEMETKQEQFLIDQKQDLNHELSSLEQELSLQTMSEEEYSSAMKDISKNKEVFDESISKVEKEISDIKNKIEVFNEEEEKKKQRIFSLQDSMQENQTKLNEIINKKNEKQIVVARLDTKQEDLLNEVYQELNTSIESIAKRDGFEINLSEIESVQTQIQKLKYKLTLIGGIDEEVVEEYKETRDRHESLITQLDDLKKAFDDLESLVVDLDDIMKKKRDKSFKKIQKEFRRYFSLLFDGGKADLIEIMGTEEEKSDEDVLKEEGDEIENEELVEEKQKKKKKKKILQGMDIVACPPGKKINDIQALSGGERTLTSIALVCAILHVNPPPFSVLDEVEAALDEANTLRFNKILSELAEQSQFVVITHNRATMHAADALYGVTMGGKGVSHLLSVKLEDAKRIVEKTLA
jgi:chromosome segregation protein